jgi:hypothetical protein
LLICFANRPQGITRRGWKFLVFEFKNFKFVIIIYFYMKENQSNTDLAHLKSWLTKKYKTVSAEEIIAKGGTEAYTEKYGTTNNAKLTALLEKLSDESHLTDEELETALKLLNETK